MNMVIISTISAKGTLMEQYLAKEAEGMELFMSILRRYEDNGFNIHGGNIGMLYEKAKLYEDGHVSLEKEGYKLVIYVREREVI